VAKITFTTFKGGSQSFFQTYGRAGNGGAKATGGRIPFVMKTTTDGAQVAGTYLPAIMKDGRTNTFRDVVMTVLKDRVVLVGVTADGGLYTKTPVRRPHGLKICQSGSPYRAELSLDLSTLLTSECRLKTPEEKVPQSF
jgi:hypothetical protein